MALLASVASWAGLIFLMKHKSITRASYARACALGQLAKLSEKGMAAIAAAYGEAPPTFGFEPINTRAPATGQAVPVVPIEDDFDEVPPDQVEVIPVEEPDSDEVPSGIAVAPPSLPVRPRGETRRHG